MHKYLQLFITYSILVLNYFGGPMKLEFDISKPNTATIQFRIDPDTKKMLTAVKKHYGVGTGQLLKKMIQECYKSIKEEL